MSGLSPGQTVLTSDGRQGVVRFIGSTQFSSGEWVGIELDVATGKNNGTVQGHDYFECAPNHGLFLRREGIAEILEQPIPRPQKKSNGSIANGNVRTPRSSSGITSDGLKKRQSLMGGPASTPSSRLAVQSPTKSPTKPDSSAESSVMSTPRTSTPSNAARSSMSGLKSRPSNGPRVSMGPPKPPVKTAPAPLRPLRSSLSSSAPRTARQSTVSSNIHTASRARPSLSGPRSQVERQIKIKEEEPELDDSAQDPVEMATSHEEPALIASKLNTATVLPSEKERKPPLHDMSSGRPAPQSSAGAMELRRENEQLKAKIRAMEAKLKDNRNEMVVMRKENEEKAKYEAAVQKLKLKIQPQQQENMELRGRLAEADAKYAKLEEETEGKVLEYESMFLDKEVAREQAADLEMQLHALEDRQAEMDEEIEVLRMENQELTADVSPEDKASTNWIHMVQENDRLQKALRLLREMQQESELEMKAEIKQLNDEVAGLETVKEDLDLTSEKLEQTEMARQMLRDQVDSLEEAEDTFLHQEEKLHNKETELAQLQNELDYLKAVEETNDDLIQSYEADILQLNGEIDDRNSRLAEHIREMARQRQAVEDLEFVLNKFRNLVADYQKREEELRLSQQVSEAEAGDLMTKSRAIMDLNLKLQNSAVKHQLRSIDMELRHLKAEEASQQLEIVQLFLPTTFETEKIPIAAFFCFKRIHFKANMVQKLLREDLENDTKVTQDETWIVFDIVEKMFKMSIFCDRFVKYISTCSAESFQKFEGALFEIEPVERQLNVWIEELRGDGLSKVRCSSELMGLLAFFVDLTEKMLPTSPEVRANAMIANAALILNFVENVSVELEVFRSSLRTLPEPTGEQDQDEIGITHQQLEKLIARIRSIKVVAGKASRNLAELTGRNLVLDEEVGLAFEQAQQISHALSQFLRCLGEEIQNYMHDDSRAESRCTSEALRILSQTTISFFQSSQVSHLLSSAPDDIVNGLSQVINLLSNDLEKLALEAADHLLTAEFELNQHPWIVRANAMKSDKSMAPDTEALVSRLRDSLAEQSRIIAEKEKSMEEQHLRIELLESRTRDSKEQASIVKGLEAKIERAKRERDEAQGLFDAARTDSLNLKGQYEQMQAELEVLQRQARQQGNNGIGGLGAKDLLQLQIATAEVERLQSETSHLQAAIRYLREENRRARFPASSSNTIEHAWLSAPLGRNAVGPSSERAKATATDCERAFDELIRISQSLKPVSLKNGTFALSVQGEKASIWRPLKTTPRYHALKQREQLEKWSDFKNEIMIMDQVPRRHLLSRHKSIGRTGLHLGKGPDGGEIQIVGSPP